MFVLLLVLVTSGIAAATSVGAAVKSEASIRQSQPSTPFYQDTKALLSSPGILSSSEHAREGGGFHLLFIPLSARWLFIRSSASIALASPCSALLFKLAILYPFHSFW